MALLLRTRVLSTSHGYKEVSTDDVFHERGRRVDWSAFQQKGNEASIDLRSIVSNAQKPKWSSIGVRFAPSPICPIVMRHIVLDCSCVAYATYRGVALGRIGESSPSRLV